MTCAHIAASKGSVAVIKELMRSNKSLIASARTKASMIQLKTLRQRSVLIMNLFMYDGFRRPILPHFTLLQLGGMQGSSSLFWKLEPLPLMKMLFVLH